MTTSLSRSIFTKLHRVTITCSRANFIRNRHDIPSYSFKVQNPEDFNERVLKSNKPIIVDFHATWCSPCKLLAPRIESVIDEKGGKVLLAKVDIDEMGDTALNYEVNAVPVLLTFKNGVAGERIIGLQDEDKLRTFINRFIDD